MSAQPPWFVHPVASIADTFTPNRRLLFLKLVSNECLFQKEAPFSFGLIFF